MGEQEFWEKLVSPDCTCITCFYLNRPCHPRDAVKPPPRSAPSLPSGFIPIVPISHRWWGTTWIP